MWREFKERIAYLQDVIARKQPADFEEIEALVLSELEHVLQENSVYIKLEPMRPSILEKNVDPALLDRMKEDLAARFLELSDNLSRSGAVSREDVLDIFFALLKSTLLRCDPSFLFETVKHLFLAFFYGHVCQKLLPASPQQPSTRQESILEQFLRLLRRQTG